MKKIAYTNSDGGVSIVTPAAKTDIEKNIGSLTDAEYESLVREQSIPAGVMDTIDIDSPPTNDFRGAWVIVDNVITVDMPKAREIHRGRLRKAREPEFAKNDIAINDAILADDATAKTAAIARRDELRNAPASQAIEDALTPEELALVFPGGLRPLN